LFEDSDRGDAQDRGEFFCGQSSADAFDPVCKRWGLPLQYCGYGLGKSGRHVLRLTIASVLTSWLFWRGKRQKPPLGYGICLSSWTRNFVIGSSVKLRKAFLVTGADPNPEEMIVAAPEELQTDAEFHLFLFFLPTIMPWVKLWLAECHPLRALSFAFQHSTSKAFGWGLLSAFPTRLIPGSNGLMVWVPDIPVPCRVWTATYRFRTPRTLWDEAAQEPGSHNPSSKASMAGRRFCKDELDLRFKLRFGAMRSEIIASAETLGSKPLSVVAGHGAISP
jgi:hypothetical protein